MRKLFTESVGYRRRAGNVRSVIILRSVRNVRYLRNVELKFFEYRVCGFTDIYGLGDFRRFFFTCIEFKIEFRHIATTLLKKE